MIKSLAPGSARLLS